MIEKLDQCPHCESSEMQEVVYADDIVFRGKSLHVDGLRVYSCQACGEECMTAGQFKANGSLIAVAKAAAVDQERERLGLLQAEEIRRIRELFGLTQKVAAQVFGGGANAFSKYERGEGKQSDAMDRLLRLVAAVPAAARWLFEQYAIDFNAGLHENHVSDYREKRGPLSSGYGPSFVREDAVAWVPETSCVLISPCESATAVADEPQSLDVRNLMASKVVWRGQITNSLDWQEAPLAA